APLGQALAAFRELSTGDDVIRWVWLASRGAADLWDEDAWHVLTTTGVRLARESGALTALPYALTGRAALEVHCRDFCTASALATEADAIATEVGCPPVADASLLLAAWRGHEASAMELIGNARRDAHDRGEGITLTVASLCAAVLYNGLGRYDEALE